MRPFRIAVMAAAAGLVPLAVPAQDPALGASAAQVSVVILDQDRLFVESRFGKAVLARHQQSVEALQAENRRIESALEAEERDLTDRRARLPAAEFQTLAADFDSKAEGIRKAQTAKSDEIKARLEAEQRRFVETARPVLDGLMREMGALVMLDARAVIFSQSGVDVTAVAIARLDSTLGDGSTPAPEAAAPEAPAPENTAPAETAPQATGTP